MATDIIAPDRYIAAIPLELMDVIWSEVEPLLQLAIDESPDDLTMECVKSKIYSGHSLLLVLCSNGVIDIALTHEIREFDTGQKALYTPLVGGKGMDKHFDDWFNVAKELAKELGCNQIRGFAARDGWLKYLKRVGWEEVHTTIRIKLD